MKNLIQKPQEIDPAAVAAMEMMKRELRKSLRIPLAALTLCCCAAVILAKCLHVI